MKRMNRKNVYCRHGSSHSFLPRRSVDQSQLVIGIADLTHYVQHHFLVGRKIWRGMAGSLLPVNRCGNFYEELLVGRCGFRSEGINRSEHLKSFLEFTAGASNACSCLYFWQVCKLGRTSQCHQINLDITGPIDLPHIVGWIEFPLDEVWIKSTFHQRDFPNSVGWNWLESTID